MSRDTESGNFGKAMMVILLVVGGYFAYDRWFVRDPAPPVMVTRPTPVAQIAPADSAAAREQQDARPAIANVYECDGPGGRVLSDEPCADDAKVREIKQPNRLDQKPEPAKAKDR